MRTFMTLLVASVVTIGIASASTTSEAPSAGTPTAPGLSPRADDAASEAVEYDGYECRYSPYCRKASQCEAYCAGGAPVCSNGCCACAS